MNTLYRPSRSGTRRLLGAAALLSFTIWTSASAGFQDQHPRDEARRLRLTPVGASGSEGAAVDALTVTRPTEAPTGFDNLTNGFDPQGPPFDTHRRRQRRPARARSTTTASSSRKSETIADGLGPTYNAQSCRECHQNVVTGGASQIAEHRTGHLHGRAVLRVAGRIAGALAGDASRASWSWWPSRTTSGRSGSRPTRWAPASSRRSPTARCSAIRDAQPASMRGAPSCVPVLEADGQRTLRPLRVEEPARQPRVVCGRRLPERDGHHQPALPRGEHVGRPRRQPRSTPCADPEDDGVDVVAFANFMRATKAPPRGADHAGGRGRRAVVQRGSAAPPATSPSITTARPGTVINGGAFTVPSGARATRSSTPTATSCCTTSGPATAFRSSRSPEFASTANQIRTAPLWALRTATA